VNMDDFIQGIKEVYNVQRPLLTEFHDIVASMEDRNYDTQLAEADGRVAGYLDAMIDMMRYLRTGNTDTLQSGVYDLLDRVKPTSHRKVEVGPPLLRKVEVGPVATQGGGDDMTTTEKLVAQLERWVEIADEMMANDYSGEANALMGESLYCQVNSEAMSTAIVLAEVKAAEVKPLSTSTLTQVAEEYRLIAQGHPPAYSLREGESYHCHLYLDEPEFSPWSQGVWKNGSIEVTVDADINQVTGCSRISPAHAVHLARRAAREWHRGHKP
jgi:hypothetical protein